MCGVWNKTLLILSRASYLSLGVLLKHGAMEFTYVILALSLC